MEYHEIGEKFEYYGVILEVTEARYCKDCFFLGKLGRCILESPMYCGSNTRVDNKRISYKRVEQCKTKDMEQKTEFMVAGTDKVFATHVGNVQSARKYTARCSTSCLRHTRLKITIIQMPSQKCLTNWALIMPTENCVRR